MFQQNTKKQVRKQNFFKAGDVSLNQDTSINIVSKTRKKVLEGNILEYFLFDTIKTTFRMENLAKRQTQSGHFFQKQGTFFNLQKSAGGGGGALFLSSEQMFVMGFLIVNKWTHRVLCQTFLKLCMVEPIGVNCQKTKNYKSRLTSSIVLKLGTHQILVRIQVRC